MIINLLENNFEVYVAYSTNGDAEKKIGNKRIFEAIKANAVLGVDSNHVIFLGYPNEWSGSCHIYNAPDSKCLISKLGKTETNCIDSHPEFCFLTHGVHRKFTRANFKNDIKELILTVLPDLIISPEFDSHPDHRALSLLFDEIMGNILKERSSYRPIILKKYIHEGVWNGPKDYYKVPGVPTQTNGIREYSGCTHDLDSPNFRWLDRLRFAVDSRTMTPLLRNNIVYKAAKMHKLTTAWYEMQRVINADIVYWQRPTKNLALNATFSASSGEVSFLNDFMHYNSSDIMNIKEPFINENKYCWVPDESDKKKKIEIELNSLNRISKVVIYEDCNFVNHIKKLRINVGSYSKDIELNSDGTGTILELPNLNVKSLSLELIDYVGIPAISEIEIFDDNKEDFSIIPLKFFVKSDELSTRRYFSQYLEMFFLILKFLLVFKIKYWMFKLLKK